MPELRFRLVDDDATFDAIPDPMAPGARCQTCDYWERVDGHREGPAEGATDAEARASLKRSRLRGDTARGGSLGMVAFDGEALPLGGRAVRGLPVQRGDGHPADDHAADRADQHRCPDLGAQ